MEPKYYHSKYNQKTECSMACLGSAIFLLQVKDEAVGKPLPNVKETKSATMNIFLEKNIFFLKLHSL